jgi:REP element-mobilizing transposase RayT
MSDPIAYFITFRTYGTWLHGDPRGSIDREHNIYNTDCLKPDPSRERVCRRLLAHPPVRLTVVQRKTVHAAIEKACTCKGWQLHVVNVRTNHVHVVITANSSPEMVMSVLKSWSTRSLRQTGLRAKSDTLWARHGSTRYIWKEHFLLDACRNAADIQGVPSVADVNETTNVSRSAFPNPLPDGRGSDRTADEGITNLEESEFNHAAP